MLEFNQKALRLSLDRGIHVTESEEQDAAPAYHGWGGGGGGGGGQTIKGHG